MEDSRRIDVVLVILVCLLAAPDALAVNNDTGGVHGVAAPGDPHEGRRGRGEVAEAQKAYGVESSDTDFLQKLLDRAVIGTAGAVVVIPPGIYHAGSLDVTCPNATNNAQGENFLTVIADDVTIKGRKEDSYVLSIHPTGKGFCNGVRIKGRPVFDMADMPNTQATFGLTMDHSYDDEIQFAVINEPDKASGLNIMTGVYTTRFYDVHVGRINISGESLGDAVTTLTFINSSFEQANINYGVSVTFLQPVIQGNIDKLVLANVSGITIIGGDVEDTTGSSTFLKLGENCNYIASINNHLAGASLRYMSGTAYPSLLMDFQFNGQQSINVQNQFALSTNSNTMRYWVDKAGKQVWGDDNSQSQSGARFIWSNNVDVPTALIRDAYSGKRLLLTGTSTGFKLDGATDDGHASRLEFDINGEQRIFIDTDGRLMPTADGTADLGGPSNRWMSGYFESVRMGSGTAKWTSGSGIPEGVVSAPVGSLYTRTDGGVGSTLYVKESGSGSSGWVAK